MGALFSYGIGIIGGASLLTIGALSGCNPLDYFSGSDLKRFERSAAMLARGTGFLALSNGQTWVSIGELEGLPDTETAGFGYTLTCSQDKKPIKETVIKWNHSGTYRRVFLELPQPPRMDGFEVREFDIYGMATVYDNPGPGWKPEVEKLIKDARAKFHPRIKSEFKSKMPAECLEMLLKE